MKENTMKDIAKKSKADLIADLRECKQSLKDSRFHGPTNTDKVKSRKDVRKKAARISTQLNVLAKKEKINNDR